MVSSDTPSRALLATEHELRCMVESRCSPGAVGLYAVTRLDAHARDILAVRRQLFEEAERAPVWSPLRDPGVRAEIDDYFRTISQGGVRGYGAAAFAQYRRRTEAFVQRMELVLQQSGSPKTGRVLHQAIVAGAAEAAMGTLTAQCRSAGAPAAILTSAGADFRGPASAVNLGHALYAMYGVRLSARDRFQQWRRPTTIADVRTPTLPSALGEVGRWMIDLDRHLAYIEQIAPDFGAFVELETALPPGVAIHNRQAIQARVQSFRDFEAQLPAVERSERTYLFEATTPHGIHTASVRPPLVDVAQLVTYQRIRNHADPFAVLNTNFAAVGIGGAIQVVRAAEIALTRRYEELHSDRLMGTDGDVFHRPAGFDVHPRYRALAQRAVAAQKAPEFLEEIFHSFADGERDLEYLRIDRYVSRLVEAGCIRTAIGIIRPLTRGELIGPPAWPKRIAPVTNLMFDELHGSRPLVDAGGGVIAWQELVARHPEAKPMTAAHDGMERDPVRESPWIKPSIEEAEAYAVPAPGP